MSRFWINTGKLGCQVFFGKFSSKLNQYCQDHDIPPPYQLCYAEDPLEHIVLMLEQDEAFVKYYTSQRIEFSSESFATSLRSFRRRNEKPFCYCTQKIDTDVVKVLGYRKKVFNHKAKKLYYFIDKSLFMIEGVFSSSKKFNDSKLVEQIMNQFGIEESFDAQNFYIFDDHNSLFLFENNGFNVTIKVFDLTNSSIFRLWENVKKLRESIE